jgi:hypothetical protein
MVANAADPDNSQCFIVQFKNLWSNGLAESFRPGCPDPSDAGEYQPKGMIRYGMVRISLNIGHPYTPVGCPFEIDVFKSGAVSDYRFQIFHCSQGVIIDDRSPDQNPDRITGKFDLLVTPYRMTVKEFKLETVGTE